MNRVLRAITVGTLVAAISIMLASRLSAQTPSPAPTQKKYQAKPPATQPFGAQAFETSDRTIIRWTGNAGFFINSRGTTFMIDPLLQGFDMPILIDMPILPKDVPRLDAVLVTHSDNDHYSIPTLRDLAPVTKVFHSTAYVSSLMKTQGWTASGHAIGDVFAVGPVNVKLTPADHAWQNSMPPREGQRRFGDDDACGFWIETPDGVIWHPGDSRLMPQHLTMPAPDAILFDFSDNEWHFGLAGAAKLANAYPNTPLLLSHWGTVDAPDFTPFNGDPAKLAPLIVNPERIRVLAPGEPYVLTRVKSATPQRVVTPHAEVQTSMAQRDDVRLVSPEPMKKASDVQSATSGVPQPGATPAFTVAAPPVTSPEVSADGRVTLRLRAPGAGEVLVRGITQTPLPMQKDGDGIWSVTTDALKPDLYAYAFLVDGLSIVDPSNTKFRPAYRTVNQSAVLVPGANAWTPRPNVRRGAVARHAFHSAVADDNRDIWVYTPPDYDPRRHAPYPVLYLQHGLFDDAKAWIDVGSADVILDNLIADGKATPMIVVSTLGYGNADGPAGHAREDMIPSFGRILIEEVLPIVEKQYHASTRREDRALAGLSMGGGEATLIGLNRLDTFAWIGSFSGAYNLWPLTRPATAGTQSLQPGSEGPAIRTPAPLALDTPGLPKSFPALDRSSNAKISLLWITCGTADGLIRVNRQFKDYLNAQGVNVTYAEVPDVGHVWPFWRQSLTDFAPLLFK